MLKSVHYLDKLFKVDCPRAVSVNLNIIQVRWASLPCESGESGETGETGDPLQGKVEQVNQVHQLKQVNQVKTGESGHSGQRNENVTVCSPRQWCRPALILWSPRPPPARSHGTSTPEWTPLLHSQRSWKINFMPFLGEVFPSFHHLKACFSSSYVRSRSMSSSRRDIGFVSFMASFAPFPPFGALQGSLLGSPVGYSPFFSGEGALQASSLC